MSIGEIGHCSYLTTALFKGNAQAIDFLSERSVYTIWIAVGRSSDRSDKQ